MGGFYLKRRGGPGDYSNGGGDDIDHVMNLFYLEKFGCARRRFVFGRRAFFYSKFFYSKFPYSIYVSRSHYVFVSIDTYSTALSYSFLGCYFFYIT